MNVEDLRISKIRIYLFEIVNTLASDKRNKINANMLSNDVNNYSLDKLPVKSDTEKPWIIGIKKKKDVYSFRGRMPYSQDTITNLKNIGFFEQFENMIISNNKEGILPEIEGIESIECISPGTMIRNSDGKTAEFEVKIQVTYRGAY